jgi:CBS domain-containing membrane protein
MPPRPKRASTAIRGSGRAPARLPLPPAFAQFVASFWPAPFSIDTRERWRMAVGPAFGVFLTAITSHWLLAGNAAAAWLVAPIGASALLVFALPGSPMAQPWSVLAGNTLSTLVGIACAQYIPDTSLAAPVCLAAAIALMLLLRCLHPPGASAALLMVLTHTRAPVFAFTPVLCNSVVLVAAGIAYNRLTGRAYPHPQLPPVNAGPPRTRFTTADLDAALAHYNQVLDVSRDDLESLLEDAEAEAYRRNLGDLRCREVMTREVHVAHFGTPLQEGWNLLRKHRIKALPVIDGGRRIVGIVTPADFMLLAGLDEPRGLGARLRDAMSPSGMTHAGRAEVVGQIMTQDVQVARGDDRLADLIPLFSSSGHHHLPVVDDENRLAGLLTQTDLVRALHRAVRP